MLLLSLTILFHVSGTSKLITMPPKPGSTFTYVHVFYDSLNRRVEGNIHVDTVMATGLSLYGKKNIMSVHSRIRSSGNTPAYYNFEPNGDISLYFENIRLWLTYPIQSHSHRTYIFIDTISDNEHTVSKANISYEGISTMSLGDTSLAVTKIKWFGLFTFTNSVMNYTDTIIAYYYFAPSIGYLVKQRTEGGTDRAGNRSNTDEFVLTKFSLK
jgi:hypothetical protein